MILTPTASLVKVSSFEKLDKHSSNDWNIAGNAPFWIHPNEEYLHRLEALNIFFYHTHQHAEKRKDMRCW